jgi:hypothetical protein
VTEVPLRPSTLLATAKIIAAGACPAANQVKNWGTPGIRRRQNLGLVSGSTEFLSAGAFAFPARAVGPQERKASVGNDQSITADGFDAAGSTTVDGKALKALWGSAVGYAMDGFDW